MLNDNSDVLINTPVYGIHHPKNYHSFTATHYVFLPLRCYICTQTVYPLVSACICLRCRCFVHRGCVTKKSKCDFFTFRNNSKSVNNLVAINSTTTSASTINNANDIENIIDRARNIPKMLDFLPVPGSEFCLWRSILRAIARHHIAHSRTISSIPNDSTQETIDGLITDVLNDSDTFPGQVVLAVHSVYLQLTFQPIVGDIATKSMDSLKRHRHTSDKHKRGNGRHDEDMTEVHSSQQSKVGKVDTKEALLHGREMFDTVICAVLSIIVDNSNLNHLSTSSSLISGSMNNLTLFAMICNTVENYVLKLNFNILYNKLFKYCIMSCPTLNRFIPQVIANSGLHSPFFSATENYVIGGDLSTTTDADNLNYSLSDSAEIYRLNDAYLTPLLSYYNDTRLLLLDSFAIEIGAECLAINKLHCVVKLLQQISVVFTMQKVEWNEYDDSSFVEMQPETEIETKIETVSHDLVPTAESVSSVDEATRNGVDKDFDTVLSAENSSSSSMDVSPGPLLVSVSAEGDDEGDYPDIQHSTRSNNSSKKTTHAHHHLHIPRPSLHEIQSAIVSMNKTVVNITANNIQQHIVQPLRSLSSCGRSGQRPWEARNDDGSDVGAPLIDNRVVVSEQILDDETQQRQSDHAHNSSHISQRHNAHLIDRTPAVVTVVEYCGGIAEMQPMQIDEDHFKAPESIPEDVTVTRSVVDGNNLNDVEGDHNKEENHVKPQRTLETDELLRIFCSLIVKQIHTNKVHWLAEYTYITSVLLRDADNMLGVEGYALATLEQCIHCITTTVIEE